MTPHALTWIFAAAMAFLGVIAMLVPRVSRRGLLFGVYVGEAAHDGETARAIRRGWSAGMAIVSIACVAAIVALGMRAAPIVALVAPELALLAAATLLYLRAHRAARGIARDAGSLDAPPAALPDATAAPAGTIFPVAVVALALVAGGYLTAVTAQQYDALPARVPIHFNAAGTPDGFAAKSPGSVFALPVMTAVMGLFIGGIAALITRVRPAVRAGDGGTSAAAQARFRTAMARYLSMTGLLVVAMLASLAYFSLRVAGGAATGLPSWLMLEAFALVAWTIGGVIYLFARYGQGGSRLEGATSAPLADGLADNSRWRLGMIYVNRDDPSWLVERRFGLGYTLNFGNPKAIVALAAFLAALVALAVWAR